jgi:hypothetical protein
MLNPFFEKLKPADLIAVILILYGLRILQLGENAVVSGLLISIVGFYFTFRLTDDNRED